MPSSANGKPANSQDNRAAPRHTLLIRAARLVAPNGEFVCVIRDISETGISVRLFHALPAGGPFEVQMPGGNAYEVETVWARSNEAGFKFSAPVDIAAIIDEAADYPRRGLRLEIQLPIRIMTLTQSGKGIVENLSQQGARFKSKELFAIDQTLRISGHDFLNDIRAKVRWRRDERYGVVFDDTFTLGDFARFAARIQAPSLLKV